MFFREHWKSRGAWLRVILVLLYLLSCLPVGYAADADEDITEIQKRKLCSNCDYCDKRCADYSEENPKYKTCWMTQMFCCGRKDKCSPFSPRKIPPWGWGLITMAICTTVILLTVWLCSGRVSCFREWIDGVCGIFTKGKPRPLVRNQKRVSNKVAPPFADPTMLHSIDMMATSRRRIDNGDFVDTVGVAEDESSSEWD